MTDYPDPYEYAEKVASDPDTVGYGVAHDELVEARVDTGLAHEQVRDMAVEIDGICDDLGLFPEEVRAELRETQNQLNKTAGWTFLFREALSGQLNELEEE